MCLTYHTISNPSPRNLNAKLKTFLDTYATLQFLTDFTLFKGILYFQYFLDLRIVSYATHCKLYDYFVEEHALDNTVNSF